MTTPEIDVAPSTVECGDKPGANFPVDAAPPKDPMSEIAGFLDAFESAVDAFWQPEHDGSDRAVVAARAALLSAVASLRERAEEAERRLESVTARLSDFQAKVAAAEHVGGAECSYCHGVGACPRCWGRAGIERAESSLERMRERVAGLESAGREAGYGLLSAWRMLSAIYDSEPSSGRRKARDRAFEHLDALRRALASGASSSIPESADQPTDDERARWDRETLP